MIWRACCRASSAAPAGAGLRWSVAGLDQVKNPDLPAGVTLVARIICCSQAVSGEAAAPNGKLRHVGNAGPVGRQQANRSAASHVLRARFAFLKV